MFRTKGNRPIISFCGYKEEQISMTYLTDVPEYLGVEDDIVVSDEESALEENVRHQGTGECWGRRRE